MVTAETAMTLPFLVVVLALLLWLVSLGLTQVRLVDAAREGARAVARGDDVAQVRAAVLREAPDRTRVDVGPGDGPDARDGLIRVVARTTSAPRLPLLGDALSVDLRSTAVTAAEDGVP